MKRSHYIFWIILMVICIIVDTVFAIQNYNAGATGKMYFSIFAGVICVVALVSNILGLIDEN